MQSFLERLSQLYGARARLVTLVVVLWIVLVWASKSVLIGMLPLFLAVLDFLVKRSRAIHKAKMARMQAALDAGIPKRIAKYLGPNDVVIWWGRLHPISTLHWCILLGVAIIGTPILLVLGFPGIIGPAGVFAALFSVWKILDIWYFTWVAITTKRIMKVHGVISTHDDAIDLRSITSVRQKDPWWSKMLARFGVIREFRSIEWDTAVQNESFKTIYGVHADERVKEILDDVRSGVDVAPKVNDSVEPKIRRAFGRLMRERRERRASRRIQPDPGSGGIT